jgi:nucleotidyltransferase substrate binding protein (TIGR01987 family)
MLELTSFQKAIESLQEAFDCHQKGAASLHREIVRDSVIQRFEYTYELAWKMMKRWLEMNLGSSYVDGIPRKELFRLAAEHHLIEDPTRWFAYHEARNQTSHVYDESVAKSVFGVTEPFLEDVEQFLSELEKRND